MAKTVDTRVVELAFQNDKFEKGVNNSLKSLDHLNGSLMTLKDMPIFEKMADSLDKISNKFTVFGQMGMRVLQRITDKVIELGTTMAKNMVMPPSLIGGFSEYELKMSSVQTIMAGTGESVETVNKYLNELNEYSDRTIYSFSDMTSNIGKFTNAGISLDKSVAAIKGISNAAALAGANSWEASRAMYNFGQALSSGFVKLIDWKSIELANMGTIDFKNYLLQTAVAMGTVTKTGDGYYKTITKNLQGKVSDNLKAVNMFNDGLQYQWLTTEVLTKALGDYADETTEVGKRAMEAATRVSTFSKMIDTMKESIVSGWAQSVEMILGDFEEATRLWTGISRVLDKFISNSAKARNETISFWKVNGGRDAMIESIANAVIALYRVLKSVKNAWESVFPPKSSSMLVSIFKQFSALTGRLIISKDTMLKLQKSFEGFFQIIKFGTTIFKGFFGIFIELAKNILPLVGSALGVISGVLSKFFNFINPYIVDVFSIALYVLSVALGKLSDIISRTIVYFQNLFGTFSNMISQVGILKTLETIFVRAFTAMSNGVTILQDKLQSFGERFPILGILINGVLTAFKVGFALIYIVVEQGIMALGALKDKFSEVFTVFSQKGFVPALEVLAGGFATFFNKVKTMFSSASTWGSSIKDFFGNALVYIQDMVNNLINEVSKVSSKYPVLSNVLLFMLNILKKVVEGFQFTFDLIGPRIAATINWFGKLANTVMEVVGILASGGGFSKAIEAIGSLFKSSEKNVSTFTNSVKKMSDNIDTSIIGRFASALSDLNPFAATAAYAEEATSSLQETQVGLMTVTKTVGGFGSILTSILSKIGGLITGFISHLNFINVMGVVLMSTVFMIGKTIFSFVKSVTGLVGAAGKVINSFSSMMDRFGKESVSDKLRAFAVSVGILSGALFLLSRIPADKLYTSTIVLTALMLSLVGAMIAFSKLKVSIDNSVSVALIAFGIGLMLLARATAKLAEIRPDMFVPAILASLSLLGVLTIAIIKLSEALQKSQNFGQITSSVIGLSVALYVISRAIANLASLDITALTFGFIAIAGIMGGLWLFISKLSKAGVNNMVGVGTSMVGLAIAMRILFGALVPFSKIEMSTLNDSLMKLARTLVVFVAPLALLSLKWFDPSKLTKVGFTLISMAFAIRLLAGAIAIMSKNESAIGVIRSFTNMLGGLTLGLVALAVVEKGLNVDIAKLAGTITKISGAFALLALAMVPLSLINYKNIEGALFGILGLILLMAAGGYIATLPNMAKGMITFAKALGFFGKAIIGIGAGIAALAFGLLLLGSLGSLGAYGLMVFFQTLSENAAVIWPAVPLLAALGASLVLLGVSLALLGGSMVLISMYGKVGMVGLFGFLGSLILFHEELTAAAPALSDISRSIGILGVAFGALALALGYLGIIGTIQLGVILFAFTKFGEGMQANTKIVLVGTVPILGLAGALFLLSLALGSATLTGGLFVGLVAVLILSLGLLVFAVTYLIKTLEEVDGEKIGDNFVEIGGTIIKGILNGLKNGAKYLLNAVWDLGKSLLNKFRKCLGIASPSKEFENTSEEIPAGIESGIKKGANKAEGAAEDLGLSVSNKFKESTTNIEEIGEQTGDAYIQGLNNKKEDAKKASADFSDIIIGPLNDNRGKATIIGNDISMGYADRLADGEETAKTNSQKMADVTIGPLKANKGQATIIGNDISMDYANRLADGEETAKTNSQKLANASIEPLKKAGEEAGKLGEEVSNNFANAGFKNVNANSKMLYNTQEKKLKTFTKNSLKENKIAHSKASAIYTRHLSKIKDGTDDVTESTNNANEATNKYRKTLKRTSKESEKAYTNMKVMLFNERLAAKKSPMTKKVEELRDKTEEVKDISEEASKKAGGFWQTVAKHLNLPLDKAIKKFGGMTENAAGYLKTVTGDATTGLGDRLAINKMLKELGLDEVGEMAARGAGQDVGGAAMEGVDDATGDAKDKGKKIGGSLLQGLSESIEDLDKDWVTGILGAQLYDKSMTTNRRYMIDQLTKYNSVLTDREKLEEELAKKKFQRNNMSVLVEGLPAINQAQKEIEHLEKTIGAYKRSTMSDVNAKAMAQRLAKQEKLQRYYRARIEKFEEDQYKGNLTKEGYLKREVLDELQAKYLEDPQAILRVKRRNWDAEMKAEAQAKKEAEAKKSSGSDISKQGLSEALDIASQVPKQNKNLEEALTIASRVPGQINEQKTEVAKASTDLANTSVSALVSGTNSSDNINAIKNSVQAIPEVLVDSLKEKTPEVSSAVSDVVTSALSATTSWISVFRKLGYDQASSMADGLISEDAKTAVKKQIDALLQYIQASFEKDAYVVITPVVDMKNVEAASSSMQDLFNKKEVKSSMTSAKDLFNKIPLNYAETKANAEKVAKEAEIKSRPVKQPVPRSERDPYSEPYQSFNISITNNVRNESDIYKTTRELDTVIKKYVRTRGI